MMVKKLRELEIREYIGIANFLTSIYCMYFVWLYSQDAWWNDVAYVMSWIYFSFALVQLLFFAYNFRLFNINDLIN